MEGIIVDILIIAVFLITVGIYTYRGFAKSVMGFAVIVASFIAAKLLGGVVSDWLYDTFVFEAVSSAVHGLLEEAIGGTIDSIDTEALVELIPESVRNVIEFAGADFESIKQSIAGIDFSTTEGFAAVSDKISAPIASVVSDVAAYVALFIVGFVVFKIVSVVILGIFELPVLKTLNNLAGFLMGLVAGFLFSWGFAIVFRMVVGMLAMKYPELLPFANATDTFVYSFFTGIGI